MLPRLAVLHWHVNSLRSWHCGKPKATKHAHNRHLVAVKEWAAMPAVGGALLGPGIRGRCPIRGLSQHSPAYPSSAFLHLGSHVLPTLTAPRKGFRWCHTWFKQLFQRKLEHRGTRAQVEAVPQAAGQWAIHFWSARLGENPRRAK